VQARGAHVFIASTPRVPDASVDPTVKNYQWNDLTSGLIEAHDHEFDTAVLCDTQGFLTEGPGFNIFVVKDGALATPERGMFEGITRRSVMEIAASLQLRCEVRPVRAEEVAAADEIFVSSTAGGIMPVTVYEDHPVGDGRPGALTTRINDLYWRLHDDDALNTPVAYPA